jgi:hypothetical protein
MMYEGFDISTIDDYNKLPSEDTSEGVYYVVKINTLKRFYFYNGDYIKAFNDMQRFVSSRKDGDKLTVQLLEFSY